MVLLRADNDVDDEMEQIMHEINQSKDHGYISIIGLFKSKELRWPLYTSLGLHAIQQVFLNTLYLCIIKGRENN
jgi:hypothetical protein